MDHNLFYEHNHRQMDQGYQPPMTPMTPMAPMAPTTSTVSSSEVMRTLHPVVSHGLREAQHLGFQHALSEATAIAYLMGKGYDFGAAWQTVESWWHPGQPTPTPY
ncbi:hypothetical protein QS257_01165 [Terrilactibacillus sp. S3-3]|nr:hypothetical protein QS257_01165 [Terrilactibacillus sp. S3-3]